MAITTDYSQRPGQDIEASCLSALPDELTLFIMSFFSPKELCKCELINRQFSRLSNDETLWKILYTKNFGVTVIKEGESCKAQVVRKERNEEEINKFNVSINQEKRNRESRLKMEKMLSSPGFIKPDYEDAFKKISIS